MSAIGSASARGPEMWSDNEQPRLVGGFVEQRPQRRMLKCLSGRRVVEHALEGVVHALCFANLLDRAAVVPGVRHCGLLGAEDECMQSRHVREAFVALG